MIKSFFFALLLISAVPLVKLGSLVKQKLHDCIYAKAQTFDDLKGYKSKITFDDVVGCEHIKELLRSNILEFFNNPHEAKQGYLFVGLHATGKTFLAKAFCGEIQKLSKEQGKRAWVLFLPRRNN